MIVLITNDDGFGSKGIELLKKIASSFASEVWVVAPDTEKSATSRSSSYLVQPSIKIVQHGHREFSISSTPVDCVVVALHKIMSYKPDLVLSGVNFGSNVGDDICYSGTVGAAMEGAARLISSIALSQTYDDTCNINWCNTEKFAQEVITKLVEVGWPKKVVMNVNFPATKLVKGIRFTGQGEYNQACNITFIKNLDDSLSLDWKRDNILGSASVGKIHEGFITITPVKSDFTDYDTLNAMRDYHADKFSSVFTKSFSKHFESNE